MSADVYLIIASGLWACVINRLFLQHISSVLYCEEKEHLISAFKRKKLIVLNMWNDLSFQAKKKVHFIIHINLHSHVNAVAWLILLFIYLSLRVRVSLMQFCALEWFKQRNKVSTENVHFQQMNVETNSAHSSNIQMKEQQEKHSFEWRRPLNWIPWYIKKVKRLYCNVIFC